MTIPFVTLTGVLLIGKQSSAACRFVLIDRGAHLQQVLSERAEDPVAINGQLRRVASLVRCSLRIRYSLIFYLIAA